MSASVSMATPHLPTSPSPSGRRSRGRAASACRTRSTGRRRRRGGSPGTAGSCRPPCRSRRTSASSTASSGTSTRTARGCTGTAPGNSTVVGSVHGRRTGCPDIVSKSVSRVGDASNASRHSSRAVMAPVSPELLSPAMTDRQSARSQHRARVGAGHRGGRAGGVSVDGPRRQERRRRCRGRRHAARARARADGRHRRHRRGREGRSARCSSTASASATAARRRSTSPSTRSTARRSRRSGRGNAIAVIAMSERGTMFDPGPCVYMEKIAVGPECVGADRHHPSHRPRTCEPWRRPRANRSAT